MNYYRLTICLYCLMFGAPTYSYFFEYIHSLWATSYTNHIFKEISCNDSTTIIIENCQGSINVQGWSVNTVAIEAVITTPEEELSASLLCLKNSSIPQQLIIDGSQVPSKAKASYSFMVPRAASLIIKTPYGSIIVKHVEGSITACTQHGSITLLNTGGSIKLEAQGTVMVDIESLNEDHSCECISHEGAITLSMPKQMNANIFAKSKKGLITSTQKITLTPLTMQLTLDSWQWLHKNIRGFIGKGGASLSLQAYGNIEILKQ